MSHRIREVYPVFDLTDKEDDLGVTLIVLLAIFSALFYFVGSIPPSTEKKFMEECLKYEKQYKCTAMWRQGD